MYVTVIAKTTLINLYMEAQCKNKKNPGVGENFRTHPDRAWGLPNLLYSGFLFFSWGKAWRGVNQPVPLAPRTSRPARV
jgi:hypothetical protein